MKETDVTALAALLNRTAEEVKAAEEGGLSKLIDEFLPTVKVMPVQDFETLTENLKRQAITELDKTKLPRDIFEYVKGSVLEQKEKALAKQYNVTDYQNFDSLIEEIIKTKMKTPPDDEVKRLKDRIVELEDSHKNELSNVSKTFDNRFIDMELNRAIGELPIEAEGDKLKNQQEVVRAMVKAKHSFTVDNDKILTIRDGKPVTDTKLDPVPLNEVVYMVAKDYVNLRPEQGGRGDKSSSGGAGIINFTKYCEDNHLRPNSLEMLKAKKDFEAKGYKLEY